jgi:hypothetical protein
MLDPLGDDKMKNPIGVLAFLSLVLSTPSQTLVADNQDGAEPYLVKGQFELPLNTNKVRERWIVLGYRKCAFEGKDKVPGLLCLPGRPGRWSSLSKVSALFSNPGMNSTIQKTP